MTERNPGFEPGSSSDEKVEKNVETARVLKPATPEEMTFLECFLKDHPETAAPVEARRDCEQELREFHILLTKFEETHSLEELNSIPDVTPDLFKLFTHDKDMSAEQIETALANLTPEDAEKYTTRSPAIKDLKPIVTLMNKIELETNITQSDLAVLKAAYKILSRAVGMINNGKVDHTR